MVFLLGHFLKFENQPREEDIYSNYFITEISIPCLKPFGDDQLFREIIEANTIFRLSELCQKKYYTIYNYFYTSLGVSILRKTL